MEHGNSAVQLQDELIKDLDSELSKLRPNIGKLKAFETFWLARNRQKNRRLSGTLKGKFDEVSGASMDGDDGLRAERRTLYMGAFTVEAEYLLTIIPILKRKKLRLKIEGYLWNLELPDVVLMANTPPTPNFKIEHLSWRKYPMKERVDEEQSPS